MGLGDEKVFPLFNRRAPVLERLRGDNAKGELGALAGETVGELVEAEDGELITQELERQSGQFIESLAEQLDVDESQIEPDVAEMFMTLLTLEREDIVNDPVEEEDEEEESTATPDFNT